jgi:hypothetical protein
LGLGLGLGRQANKEYMSRKEIMTQLRKFQAEAGIPDAQIRLYCKAFEALDLDDGGTVTSDELKLGLLAVGIDVPDDVLRDYMRRIDQSNNNSIDMAEFVQFMCLIKEDGFSNLVVRPSRLGLCRVTPPLDTRQKLTSRLPPWQQRPATGAGDGERLSDQVSDNARLSDLETGNPLILGAGDEDKPGDGAALDEKEDEEAEEPEPDPDPEPPKVKERTGSWFSFAVRSSKVVPIEDLPPSAQHKRREEEDEEEDEEGEGEEGGGVDGAKPGQDDAQGSKAGWDGGGKIEDGD